jgi:hypothetical protein
LQTLCSPIIRSKLAELQIQLIGFRELDHCLANLAV